MNTVTFEVPGEPVGKGRPRFSRATGRAYTPEKTARYENLVRLSFKQSNNRPFEAGVPLMVSVEVYQQIPKSASKRKQEAMVGKKLLPMKKPDPDNILKAVLDGLNGVAYADDSQVVAVRVNKYYGEYPCAIVTIKRVGT